MRRIKSTFSNRFKQCLLILIFNTFLEAKEFKADNNPRQARYISSDDPSFDHLHNNHTRVVRQDNDKIAKLLKQTTIIAHIANAISLQSGLLNNTIKIEEVVGEICKFDSADFQRLSEWKPDNVNAFASKIKEAPSSLNPVPEDFEEKVLQWNKIIEDSENVVGDVNDTSGIDAYTSEAESLEQLDVEVIIKIETDLSESSKLFYDMKWPLTAARPIRYYTLSSWSRLPSHLQGMVEALKSFKTVTDKLVSNSLMKTGPETLKQFESFINFTEFRSNFSINAKNNETQVKNSNWLSKVVTKAQSADEDLKFMMTFAEERVGLRNTRYIGLNMLEKEIDDHWLAGILKVEGSRMNSLKKGLYPLMNHTSELIELEKKFNSIPADLHSAALKTRELKTSLASITVDSMNILEHFDECSSIQDLLNTDDFKRSRDLIKSVKALNDTIEAMEVLRTVDTDALDVEVKEFVSSIGFTDLSDTDMSYREVETVKKKFKSLKSQDLFDAFRLRIQQMVHDVNPTALKDFIIPTLTLKHPLKDPAFLEKYENEKKVHECLKKHAEKSKEAVEAVQMLRKIRDLNTTEIDVVSNAAEAISSASRGLSELQKIPEAMKKEASDKSRKLGTFSEASKVSETISKSVQTLRDVLALKAVEIAQLKMVEVVADIMQTQEEKDRVKSQWGDHQKDMEELEKSKIAIGEFESNLKDLTQNSSLEDYGKQLKNLESIPDVKMNASEKSEALGALLAQPSILPNVTVELEKNRKIIDELAELDLGFSSHQKAYQNAPGAFKALQDFLTEFLKIEVGGVEVDDEDVDGIEDAGGTSLLLFILIGVGVAGLISVVSCLLYRHFTKTTDKMILRYLAWIKEQSNYNGLIFFRKQYKMAYRTVKLDEKAALLRLPGDRLRNTNYPCNMEGIEFESNNLTIRYNANRIKCDDDTEFIAAQGPLQNQPGKMDTRAEFLSMIIKEDSEFIVMIGGFTENGKKKQETCGKYFMDQDGDEMTIEQYKVKTISVEEMGGETKKRLLEITDTTAKDAKPKFLTHFQYLGWPMNSCPDNHKDACTIMRMVRHSKKPIIVHCSTGLDQTIAFIGLHFGLAGVKKDSKRLMITFIIELIRLRWKGIQNPLMMYWMEVGIVYMLILDVEHHKTPISMKEYTKLEKNLKIARKGYKDCSYERDDEPTSPPEASED
ncbi:hypothetical protein B9Z55_015988 [Caenorhabditis nigoni]|uniref:Tyrosine-protein phosphatase domain-containing protein n=3 Tax=Caenorhabditis nigoni TaxID=1611254 RepID=A0A2G5UCY7_9PELO|nr:hypothetical protein B9Z55_015988 [Caenorhabditis nigoni]